MGDYGKGLDNTFERTSNGENVYRNSSTGQQYYEDSYGNMQEYNEGGGGFSGGGSGGGSSGGSSNTSGGSGILIFIGLGVLALVVYFIRGIIPYALYYRLSKALIVVGLVAPILPKFRDKQKNFLVIFVIGVLLRIFPIMDGILTRGTNYNSLPIEGFIMLALNMGVTVLIVAALAFIVKFIQTKIIFILEKGK